MSEFKGFGKIPRWSRPVKITEKIDGTNAQIYICDISDVDALPEGAPRVSRVENLAIYAGSRNLWISPEKDNYGFAGWVLEHANELRALGPGRHFGEWWGAGIQRRYGLTEKRFSLFNHTRWAGSRPECCGVVPLLYHGTLTPTCVEDAVNSLTAQGSVAAPGFMDPEGIVIWHSTGMQMFKKTCKGDESPKSILT